MSYGNQLFLWLSQYGQQASSNKRNQGQLKAIVELMRLDKPWGTILLLWPTIWALWLANDGMPNAQILLVFIIGGILMRACGCVINDYCDRDIDAQVARTKSRPLAAGSQRNNHWTRYSASTRRIELTALPEVTNALPCVHGLYIDLRLSYGQALATLSAAIFGCDRCLGYSHGLQ